MNKIIIDSTHSVTDLCNLGVKYPTDKCPYNSNQTLHKHAYTSIYNFLFSSIRYKDLIFGEIGIGFNNSTMLWRDYFPNAKLFGFEYFEHRINKAISDNLVDTTYINMNIKEESSIVNAFVKANKMFDVIVEDSTHEFEDQIRLINIAYKYLNRGGLLIIEDIFMKEKEERYDERLKHLNDYFSSITFVEANHALKHSPGWDNDKLLVLCRNDH
jgi:predicted O-methyltransferase YrrM